MCNIAGYVGDKQAAPILVEMLRRQEIYDAGFSTGIVTIHKGKLYYKRVLGNVDEFLKQVDLNELPGTIGLAHSRPYNNEMCLVHPYISMNGKLALVTNGTTPKDDLIPRREAVGRMLLDNGFDFYTRFKDDASTFPLLQDGYRVAAAEILTNYIQYFMDKGDSFEKAIAKANNDMFAERVCVTISADDESKINVCRITRPMELMIAEGECYVATTRFGFPEYVEGDVVTFPTCRVCSVTKNGVEFTENAVDFEPVSEITPNTYRKAYEKIESMLMGGKDNPCVYDDIEFAMLDLKEMWDKPTRYTPYAKVGYDILWQMKEEGRLKSFLAPQTDPFNNAKGTRMLANMYIESDGKTDSEFKRVATKIPGKEK